MTHNDPYIAKIRLLQIHLEEAKFGMGTLYADDVHLAQLEIQLEATERLREAYLRSQGIEP